MAVAAILSGCGVEETFETIQDEPVVAAILGIVVFREGVTMMKLTGIVLVLSSVVVMNRQEK